MINVNIGFKGAEIINFNRLEGLKVRIHFNDNQDKFFDFIFKSTDPELAVMEMMRQLKVYEKRTVKESEDEIIHGINVLFKDEEKTTKTFTRFFTNVNEKMFYLNRAKNAQDHMSLLQGLLNLKLKI